jgi:hypothetical protein
MENQMTEPIMWIIVLGLAVVIAGFVLLSRQVETQFHDTIEIMKYSNQMILAQLELLTGSPVAVSEATVGVILERRCTQRRNLMTPINENPGKTEQRGYPGRRFADFLETAPAEYSG